MTPEAAAIVVQTVASRHKAFKQVGSLHTALSGSHRVHFKPLTVDPMRVKAWFEEAGVDTTMLGVVMADGQVTCWYAVFVERKTS